MSILIHSYVAATVVFMFGMLFASGLYHDSRMRKGAHSHG